jgi:uncharacterized protein YukE
MAFLGMELEAASQQAGVLQTQAVERLAAVIQASDALVGQLAGVWKGTDAERFISAWDSSHRGALVQVQQALASFQQELVTNIRAQQAASAG